MHVHVYAYLWMSKLQASPNSLGWVEVILKLITSQFALCHLISPSWTLDFEILVMAETSEDAKRQYRTCTILLVLPGKCGECVCECR